MIEFSIDNIVFKSTDCDDDSLKLINKILNHKFAIEKAIYMPETNKYSETTDDKVNVVPFTKSGFHIFSSIEDFNNAVINKDNFNSLNNTYCVVDFNDQYDEVYFVSSKDGITLEANKIIDDINSLNFNKKELNNNLERNIQLYLNKFNTKYDNLKAQVDNFDKKLKDIALSLSTGTLSEIKLNKIFLTLDQLTRTFDNLVDKVEEEDRRQKENSTLIGKVPEDIRKDMRNKLEELSKKLDIFINDCNRYKSIYNSKMIKNTK